MRFDIPANNEMLAAIVADAKANAGFLSPSVWPLEIETESLVDMLDGNIGSVGVLPVDEQAVTCFEPFLQEHAHLGLDPRSPLVEIKSDLGTIMDADLTTLYQPRPDSVCEVGGGFGRVAEVFLDLGLSKHYVLIDAVPAMLMYAYEYLRRACPDHRIGSFYAGDTYGPDWDCFILPAWRTDLLSEAFDLSMNIESMQEMNAVQVSFFLRLFDRVTKPDGIIYLSNARDYYYRGEWPIPARWETLWHHNTPRSWSRDHPTIILRKGTGDYTSARESCEAAFQVEMEYWTKAWADLSVGQEQPEDGA